MPGRPPGGVGARRHAVGDRAHAPQALREIVHRDFYDFTPLRDEFASCDACFFCLGVTSAGMPDADYTRVTYDLTLAAARLMAAANTGMTFCYVSGAGTDSPERGRVMWARVKGRTENALLALPFKAAYMFRPFFIQPLKGIRSKTGWYQAAYNLTASLYPVVHWLAPGLSTTSANFGKALIQIVISGNPRPIVTSRDVNRLAGST